MFDILEADIVVMQELKIQRKDLRDDMVMLDGWDCYFSLPKQKKGLLVSLSWLFSLWLMFLCYRLFWRGYIHSQRHMCSYSSRGRRSWSADTA